LITAVIDGLMGLVTLTVIFIYSPILGLVVAAAFLLYLVLRLALYRQFRERNEAVIRSKAQENSTLIETLRAIQTLKLFNRENEQQRPFPTRRPCRPCRCRPDPGRRPSVRCTLRS